MDRLVHHREEEEVLLDRRAPWLLPPTCSSQGHLDLLEGAEEGDEGEEAPGEEPDGARDLHGGRALGLDNDLPHIGGSVCGGEIEEQGEEIHLVLDLQENDLKMSIIGENQNALILFWVTFVTSVLSASLGLANCLRVAASRASFNDDGDSDENLAFDIYNNLMVMTDNGDLCQINPKGWSLSDPGRGRNPGRTPCS